VFILQSSENKIKMKKVNSKSNRHYLDFFRHCWIYFLDRNSGDNATFESP